MDQLEPQLLARLAEQGEIADTDELAQQLGVVHAALVPTIKSLDSYEMVRAQVWSHLDMQAHDVLVLCNEVAWWSHRHATPAGSEAFEAGASSRLAAVPRCRHAGGAGVQGT